jgi:hypothetical protein
VRLADVRGARACGLIGLCRAYRCVHVCIDFAVVCLVVLVLFASFDCLFLDSLVCCCSFLLDRCMCGLHCVDLVARVERVGVVRW